VLPREPRFETFTASNGVKVEYGLCLPEEADAWTPRRVLIGFPPGNQSRSAAETAMSYWWGEQAARRGWVTVTVVKPDVGWFSPGGEQAMGELLDHLSRTFEVHEGKFHVAGCSGGGPSCFHVALAFADRVASVTGLPAYPVRDDLLKLDRLRGVTVNMWVGADDGGWREEMAFSSQKMREAGARCRMVVFPDEAHVIQELLGGGFMDRLEASLVPASE
jgi:pimeloyl-ACP methyl ester carboxylesterase